MKTRIYIIIGLSLFFIMFASGFFFVVDQTKQVIVLQFGEPRAVHQTPGLKFKLPFIQNTALPTYHLINIPLQRNTASSEYCFIKNPLHQNTATHV